MSNVRQGSFRWRQGGLTALFLCASTRTLAQGPAAPTRPLVEIRSTMGTMIVALYNETPQHRDNFLKLVRAKAKDLKIDAEMLKRPVNVGFSGGEKKRNEILQMAMLEPRMCILDETDSGLDVDAMKLVADGVNALRSAGRSFLVITHYQRLLDHIRPDVVHIMAAGRIVKTGGPELALEVETNGYADILSEVG